MYSRQIWLLISEEELKVARRALKDEHILVVLTQQSAEKALNGYLAAQGVEGQKIHDLVVLLDACIALNKNLPFGPGSSKLESRYYQLSLS